MAGLQMPIKPGFQDRVIDETTLGSGNTQAQGSIQSDSLLVSLYVDSVSSGNLSVSVYTIVDDGKEVLLFTFPVISAPTANLLLRKSGATMSRFRIAATYTGVCKYSVYVRAIETAGDTSSKILGADNWTVSQISVPSGTPTLLIPSSITDRAGLIIRNWSTSGNLYVGETSGDAIPATGYPIGPLEMLAIDLSADSAVYGSSDGATLDVRIAQAGG